MADRQELATVRLPYPAEAAQYGYSAEVWRVLTEAIFPNAQSQHSVILALAYCKARGLDVMKRPVHIVPIWDKKRGTYVETIWPGIGELRTTASRTGVYAGKDAVEFGPDITMDLGGAMTTFPEWGRMTVYKIVSGVRCAFVGPKVYWIETYATLKHDSDVPNSMWATRPKGQLEKCVEAASLRAAFPEEIGNEYAAEEMEGRKFESFATTKEGVQLGKAPERKSQPAAPAAAAPAPEASAVPAAAPAVDLEVVQIMGTELKSGNGPYRIGLSRNGEPSFTVTTFSETAYKLAKKLEGKNAAVKLIQKGQYLNLEKIEEPAAAPAAAESREPGQEG